MPQAFLILAGWIIIRSRWQSLHRQKQKTAEKKKSNFKKSFILEQQAHKTAQTALQPAVQSHELLIIFSKLKKTPLEFRRGRRSISEPGNLQADSQRFSRNPPAATQKEKEKLPEKENLETKSLWKLQLENQ